MAKIFACKFKIEYDWFTQSTSMIKSKDFSSGVLTARLRKLEEHYNKLESAYENLLNVENDSTLLKTYEEQFKEASVCYNELDSISAKYHDSEGSYTTTESAAHSRLPRLELHNFDGDSFEWYSFISMFNSLVLSRKDLSKTEKYHYLFSHLYKEPRMLIQHLPMIDSSLDTGLEILKSRYENKRMLVDRYILRILNLPILSNSRNLRTDILNPLLESTRSLKNLGIPVEEWSYILLFITLTKLPNEIKTRFEHRFGGLNKDLPKFENLIDFLRQECHFVDTNYYSEFSNNNNWDKKRITATVTKSPLRLMSDSYHDKSRFVKGCIYCSGTSHTIGECFKFNNMSREDRRQWVKSKNVCFRCFGNHPAVGCTRNIACSFCSNTGHHKLICTMPVLRPEGFSKTNNTKASDNNGSFGKRHIMVGTVDFSESQDKNCTFIERNEDSYHPSTPQKDCNYEYESAGPHCGCNALTASESNAAPPLRSAQSAGCVARVCEYEKCNSE